MTFRIATAAATAIALGLAAPGFAQEASDDTTASDQQAQSSEGASTDAPQTLQEVEAAEGVSNETVDDAKITSFVQALGAMQVIANHYMPIIEAESDGAKRAEIIDAANGDIVQAIVTVENLTPAEYKAIDMAAQEDEELSNRIMAELEEMNAEARAAREAQEAEGAGNAEEGAEGDTETE